MVKDGILNWVPATNPVLYLTAEHMQIIYLLMGHPFQWLNAADWVTALLKATNNNRQLTFLAFGLASSNPGSVKQKLDYV